MYKFLLLKYVWVRNDYGDPEILGTFDSLVDVNRFLETSDDYLTDQKFISCRQINEYKYKGTSYRLDLTAVPFNPVDKIGELKKFFKEEPTIDDLLTNKIHQVNFVEHKKKGYSVHTYFGKDSLSLQLWGWAIVLSNDGTWFWEDTSGG